MAKEQMAKLSCKKMMCVCMSNEIGNFCNKTATKSEPNIQMK